MTILLKKNLKNKQPIHKATIQFYNIQVLRHVCKLKILLNILKISERKILKKYYVPVKAGQV